MKKKYQNKVFATEYKWQNLNSILKYEQKTAIDFTVYTYKHIPVFLISNTPNKPPPSLK